MKKDKVQHGTDKYFDMPAGCYCGLALEKKLAVRVQKLLLRQSAELAELIGSRIDEAHVYNWTLAYPDGEQKTVSFTSSYDNTLTEKKRRLGYIEKSSSITPLDHFFFVESDDYSDATKAVSEFYTALYSEKDDYEEMLGVSTE